jgi:hypothetical protein
MSAVAEKVEKESTELVTVPAKETALEVFKAEQGLDPYLETIRAEVDAFLASPPTLDTNKGRQAYTSMAHKIARSKAAIEAGKRTPDQVVSLISSKAFLTEKQEQQIREVTA